MKVGILWDLDGTLLDTLDDLADAVNYALDKFGYPTLTREEVRAMVGGGAKQLVAQAVPAGADPKPVHECFRSFYGENCRVKTAPYPGIMEVLESLTRYPIAVVSNKPDGAVKDLCRHYFPGVYALGERSDCPKKPAPDMVLRAMGDIGVEKCVYVGDSEVDVRTAANVGVPCLSVLWGFRDREEIEEAGGMHFCENVADLPEKLEKMIHDLTVVE